MNVQFKSQEKTPSITFTIIPPWLTLLNTLKKVSLSYLQNGAKGFDTESHVH